MTPTDARKLAEYLYSLKAVVPTKAADALVNIADQLEWLLERDTISDSKLQVLRNYSDNWKDDAMMYQHQYEEQLAINDELKKQIAMLKEALYKT